MIPNILYPTRLINSNAQYLVTGMLDQMPCTVEVMKHGSEPNTVEILLNNMELRLSPVAATELARHLSAAAEVASNAKQSR